MGTYSIEGHDGVISGEGIQVYRVAAAEAQRNADRTGQSWYVIDDETGEREEFAPEVDYDPEPGSSLAAAHVGQIRAWWADPRQATAAEVAELVGAAIDQAWGEEATLFRFDDGSAVRICGQDVDVLKR